MNNKPISCWRMLVASIHTYMSKRITILILEWLIKLVSCNVGWLYYITHIVYPFHLINDRTDVCNISNVKASMKIICTEEWLIFLHFDSLSIVLLGWRAGCQGKRFAAEAHDEALNHGGIIREKVWETRCWKPKC